MAYNPDEEPTQQIPYQPNDPSAQRPDSNLNEAPTQYTNYPPDEAPTLRRRPTPSESQPHQQGGQPPQQEGYRPVPPGRSLPPQQRGYPPAGANYPAAQVGSGGPAGPGYYPPPQGAYPPPPRSSYPPAPPAPYQDQPGYSPVQPAGYQAGAQDQQRSYPGQQAAQPASPASNTAPFANQPPPVTPVAEASGAVPYTQYQYAPPAQPAPGGSYPPAGAASGARAAFDARRFWTDLSLLGQVAGIGGLLLVIFFFLPWFYTPDFSAVVLRNGGISGTNGATVPTASHAGWSAASGLRIFPDVPALNLFPHLWLVLLCALALIVLAVLLGFQRIRPRPAALLISLISLCALLLEFFFLIQVNSIAGAMHARFITINQSLYGISWGFWLAVVATIAALGVGVYILLEAFAPGKVRRPRAPGMPGDPGQQPHPTA